MSTYVTCNSVRRRRKAGYDLNPAACAVKLCRDHTAETVKTTGPVTLNVKGATVIRYNELLERKLRDARTDVKTFFRVCHVHLFGTDPDLTGDVHNYNEKKVIPIYVQRYLDKEQSCK